MSGHGTASRSSATSSNERRESEPRRCRRRALQADPQAREHIAKAEQAHASAAARLEELRGKVGPAERRDRQRLGEALIAHKSEPTSEAEHLKAEVVRQEARVEALRGSTALARAQIPKLVDVNRAGC